MPAMKRLAFIHILLVFLLAACSPVSTAELAQNRQKWEAQHITHYRFDLSVGCFCPFGDKMPLTVEVRDGVVVSMVDNHGQPVTEFNDTFNTYNSIEKLFALLEALAKGGADKVTVTYNAQYGYPQSISIDYVQNAVDDELGLTVGNFEALK